MAARGEVLNRKPTVREPDSALFLEDQAGIVGPTMRDGVVHALKEHLIETARESD
jgi:hypothetical protein